MDGIFIVLPGEVIYPNYCPSGIVLKELNGIRQYPVDENLGKKLINRLGCKVTENIHFVVKIRTGKDIILCNEGEITGGNLVDGEWQMSIMGRTDKTPANDLNPIQFAELPEIKKTQGITTENEVKIMSKYEKRINHLRKQCSVLNKSNIRRKKQITQFHNLLSKFLDEKRITKEEIAKFIFKNN